MLGSAGHECLADPYVVSEARRNLTRVGPEASSTLEALLRRFRVTPCVPSGADLPAGLPLADNDRPILAAAIRLGCGALLTRDRTHFGALYGTAICGVAVHSPRSLAEALL